MKLKRIAKKSRVLKHSTFFSLRVGARSQELGREQRTGRIAQF